MTRIICQKKYAKRLNDTQEDVDICNEVISAGIEEVKTDWQEDSGISFLETDEELIIGIDVSSVDYDRYSSVDRIIKSMKTTLDNYGVEFKED